MNSVRTSFSFVILLFYSLDYLIVIVFTFENVLGHIDLVWKKYLIEIMISVRHV